MEHNGGQLRISKEILNTVDEVNQTIFWAVFPSNSEQHNSLITHLKEHLSVQHL